MIARPARARVVGEVEARRVEVEVVSAVCSAERRASWCVAKVIGESGLGLVDMVGCGDERLRLGGH